MDKICEMKSLLENYVSAQMCDLASAPTKELGEAIDMIKDLAEAEYYCKITKAMDDAAAEMPEVAPAPMGYNTSRYASGRYAPAGRGHYSNTGHTMGFRPVEKEYLDDYINSPIAFRESMRMGYHEPEMTKNNRHGLAYTDWSEARRHYTETKSPADKTEMNAHTNEHLADVMVTVKEMWMEADPTLRTEMKAKIQQLLNDMK